jgi:hypothetical protein
MHASISTAASRLRNAEESTLGDYSWDDDRDSVSRREQLDGYSRSLGGMLSHNASQMGSIEEMSQHSNDTSNSRTHVTQQLPTPALQSEVGSEGSQSLAPREISMVGDGIFA